MQIVDAFRTVPPVILFVVRFEEQIHMYDYPAGVYTSREEAEARKAQLIEAAKEGGPLEGFGIYDWYIWIEELNFGDVPFNELIEKMSR